MSFTLVTLNELGVGPEPDVDFAELSHNRAFVAVGTSTTSQTSSSSEPRASASLQRQLRFHSVALNSNLKVNLKHPVDFELAFEEDSALVWSHIPCRKEICLKDGGSVRNRPSVPCLVLLNRSSSGTPETAASSSTGAGDHHDLPPDFLEEGRKDAQGAAAGAESSASSSQYLVFVRFYGFRKVGSSSSIGGAKTWKSTSTSIGGESRSAGTKIFAAALVHELTEDKLCSYSSGLGPF